MTRKEVHPKRKFLFLIPRNKTMVIESKSPAPATARGEQDSEGEVEKLGSEAFEPR